MSDRKRLILMGTGPFAVPSFEALRAAGHDIAAVVTKPVPPIRSRKEPPPSPVRSWAQMHGLPILDPDTINEPAAIEYVGNLNAWLMVVCDYGHILKPAALAATTVGGINLHGSLLPAYRGAAPVQWAVLSGDRVSGVSVIHMTPRLDGGPILATEQTEIRDGETAGELESRLSQIGVAATLRSIDMLSGWDGETAIGETQDAAKITQAPRLSKSDGEIDWGRSANEIECHVRGMQPWPVAFTHVSVDANKPPVRLAIKEISIIDIDSSERCSGEILEGDGLRIATADRVIQVERLQPAGKREMKASEFLRGHRPPAGSRLF